MIDRILQNKWTEIKDLRGKRFVPRDKPVIPFMADKKINIIAELKRKSPSAGFIANIDDKRISTYSKYARAISVLTDRMFFGGSLGFLTEVAQVTSLPVLCKDFIVDPVQIDAAYSAGADLILLIVRILSDKELVTLYNHARDLGLECLVELHASSELSRILSISPTIVGANARDLDTLHIDLSQTETLLKQIHSEVRVAESGITSREDINRLKGYANAFLIGETLMRATDLDATFEGLLNDGHEGPLHEGAFHD
jgi:indole-3-glycerol phosphate synthase